MKTRTSALIVLGALLTALLPAAAAGASTSAADRLLAAGAGVGFGPAATQSSFAAQACGVDGTGDVVDLDNNDAAIDEGRADITNYCVNYGATTVTLSVTVDEATDPATDPNWQNSLLGIFIDTDEDGSGEFFAQLSADSAGGALTASVEDRSTTPASEACDAGWTYNDGTTTLTFPASCVDSPATIAVNPGVIYDQRVTDTDGVAAFDTVFEGDTEMSDPVGAGALPDGVTRLAGGERIATAIAISQQGWDDESTDTVVLARADLFPDALAGTPLAISLDAPILLTPTDSLSDLTSAEIDRVLGGTGTVVLLGGESALSADVDLAVAALGYDTVRYGGPNRFATAVSIATDGLTTPDEVLLADGGDFQDALVGGTAAGTADEGDAAALLLTDGDTIPSETQAYLDTITGDDVTAIGSAASGASPDSPSIAGDSAAATSALVAEAYFPSPTAIGISRDDVFADGLTGGALVGNPDRGYGPLLLTPTDSLAAEVDAYIDDNADTIDSAVIFGGVAAVSEDVEAEVADSI